MTDWELINISDDEPEIIAQKIDDLDTGGLENKIENLHSNFWHDANHLDEVENRHLQVLVTSGMIPEDHIASTIPSRKLSWFVNELNGRVDPDGLSIPLKGLDIGEVEIYQKNTDNETLVKLKLTEKDGQELERVFNVPSEGPDFSVQANFFNNRLYLRW